MTYQDAKNEIIHTLCLSVKKDGGMELHTIFGNGSAQSLLIGTRESGKTAGYGAGGSRTAEWGLVLTHISIIIGRSASGTFPQKCWTRIFGWYGN